MYLARSWPTAPGDFHRANKPHVMRSDWVQNPEWANPKSQRVGLWLLGSEVVALGGAGVLFGVRCCGGSDLCGQLTTAGLYTGW